MFKPHIYTAPVYGAKTQYMKPEDNSPKLLSEDKLSIQQVTYIFLYYARAVDITMFMV